MEAIAIAIATHPLESTNQSTITAPMNRAAVIFFAALASITTTGLLIRLYFATEPLWIDELHTAWTTQDSIGLPEVINRAGQGNQTPIYFGITWAFQKTLGFSITTIRLPSILCGSLIILLGGWLVRKWTNSSLAGLLTAAVLSLDYWCIFYSTEARPYALVELLAMLQVFALANETRQNQNPDEPQTDRGFSWTLILSTAMLLLTHLTTLILIACEIIIVLTLLRRFQIRRISNSLGISAVTIAACLPVLLHVTGIRSDWSQLNQLEQFLRQVWPVLIPGFLLPMLAIALYTLLQNDKTSKLKSTSLYLFGLLTILPVAMVATLQYANFAAATSLRYISFLPVTAAIFAGFSIAIIHSPTWKYVLSTLIVTCCITFNPISHATSKGHLTKFRTENWESAINQIQSINTVSSVPVFLFANLVEDHRLYDNDAQDFRNYIAFPITGPYQFPASYQITPKPTITQRNRWNASDIQRIQQEKTAVIIARTDHQLFDEIIQQLKSTANNSNEEFEFTIFEQPGNDVRFAVVKLLENPANPTDQD